VFSWKQRVGAERVEEQWWVLLCFFGFVLCLFNLCFFFLIVCLWFVLCFCPLFIYVVRSFIRSFSHIFRFQELSYKAPNYVRSFVRSHTELYTFFF